MKIKFLLNGIYIIGYTSYPVPEESGENEIIIEDVTDEILQEYMHYKVVDGALVRLSDDEYFELYPIVKNEPTEQEQINAYLMLELAKIKTGGAKNA